MIFGFNNKDRGYGFGPMPGFNKKRVGTIGMGNWDRDPKPNRKDCDPFNFKKQDGGEYAWGEKKAPKCPKCGTQTKVVDDSFDYGPGHHGSGGTEIIMYAECPKCGWEEE